MIPLRDNIPSSRFPTLTYTFIALNVLVFLGEVSLPRAFLEQFIRTFGFVPARFVSHLSEAAWAPLFLPMFTSMFLHGGWLHLIGNMWTLHIFGDNVEDTLGHVGFVLLYLACGVAACLAQLLASPGSTIPMVGASGAIAGVMGAYFSLFPWARVLTLIPFFFFVIIEVPAYVFLGFWFLLQFFSGTLSVLGPHAPQGGVAFFAHVGGFAMGVLLLRVFVPARTRAALRRGLRAW